MRFSVLILAMLMAIPAIAIAKEEKAAKKNKKTTNVVASTANPIDTAAIKGIVKETLQEVAASKKNEDEIKVNAILEAGIDINNRGKDGTRYNKIGYGKIELSARPVKKVRAEFGFEYDRTDNSFEIDKLYAQYNIGEFGSLRAGYMKKLFGFEEKAGLDERYFHKRSIVRDSLKEFNLLNHDLTMQYRHKLGDSWQVAGAFSWGSSDTTRIYQNYSVEYETPSINLVLSGIIGHYTHTIKRSGQEDPITQLRPPDTFIDTNLTSWAASLSFKYSAVNFISETEVTFGNDYMTEYNNKNPYVLGIRTQEYFPINTGLKSLRQVIPIAEATLYSKDLTNSAKKDNDIIDFDAQFRVGLTFGFAKNSAFQWRNAYGKVLRYRDDKVNTHRRRFDSEVVVIF
jgi:hypothetical protein